MRRGKNCTNVTICYPFLRLLLASHTPSRCGWLYILGRSSTSRGGSLHMTSGAAFYHTVCGFLFVSKLCLLGNSRNNRSPTLRNVSARSVEPCVLRSLGDVESLLCLGRRLCSLGLCYKFLAKPGTCIPGSNSWAQPVLLPQLFGHCRLAMPTSPMKEGS